MLAKRRRRESNPSTRLSGGGGRVAAIRVVAVVLGALLATSTGTVIFRYGLQNEMRLGLSLILGIRRGTLREQLCLLT